MSYASLINVSASTNAESFQRLRDFLGKRNGTYDYSSGGIGWTLHDSSYATNEDTLTAGDYVVFTSTGEAGRQAMYVQFVYQAAYIKLQCWLYWNNATHAGSRQMGTGSNTIYTPSGACVLWMFGDLDAVYIANTNGANTYLAGFGCLAPGDGFYDNTIAIAPSAVSTGSSVVIPVDVVPEAWAPGDKIYHWDTDGIHIVVIEAVGAGSVTLASVATGKSAGSRLSGEVGLFASVSNAFHSPYMAADRATAAACACSISSQGTGSPVYVPTDSLNAKRVAERVGIWTGTSGAFGFLPHIFLTNSSGAVQNTAHVAPDGKTYRVCRHQGIASFLVREA